MQLVSSVVMKIIEKKWSSDFIIESKAEHLYLKSLSIKKTDEEQLPNVIDYCIFLHKQKRYEVAIKYLADVNTEKDYSQCSNVYDTTEGVLLDENLQGEFDHYTSFVFKSSTLRLYLLILCYAGIDDFGNAFAILECVV